MPIESPNLAPAPPLETPAGDPPPARPAEGDWYAPQGEDTARPIDYFKDDRPLIGRIVGLAMLALIIAITATLAVAWYALPVLNSQRHHSPAIYEGPIPQKRHAQSSPTTHPAAQSPTTAPSSESAQASTTEPETTVDPGRR